MCAINIKGEDRVLTRKEFMQGNNLDYVLHKAWWCWL